MSDNNQAKSKRGGKREGAGRKEGSATKKTREIADKAAQEGITPLEVMLDNMVFAHQQAGEIMAQLLESGMDLPDGFDQLKELLRFRGIAQEAAKDAAPYIHPRLAAIEHTGKGGEAINMNWQIEFVKPSDEG